MKLRGREKRAEERNVCGWVGGEEYCAYERKCQDGLPIRKAQKAAAITLGGRVEKE